MGCDPQRMYGRVTRVLLGSVYWQGESIPLIVRLSQPESPFAPLENLCEHSPS
jgi:hypothetical protein